MLKRGTIYNYTCKINPKCPRNCYVISKNNSFDLYLRTEEGHYHDLSDYAKRRNILIEMCNENNFSLENVNKELSKEGIPIMDKYSFSYFKHRIKTEKLS